MTEKKAITRKATAAQAASRIEGSDAWTGAIAGIVGGWLVFVGSLANAIKLSKQHKWPWETMLGTWQEKLFFGGILAVGFGYPLMRFTTPDKSDVEKKIEEENNGP